MKVIPHRVR